MGQETLRRNDDDATGRDLPNADGTVSDEDVNAISDDGSGKKTGQDHSLDNHEQTMPEHGVGSVQSTSDPTTDVARMHEVD